MSSTGSPAWCCPRGMRADSFPAPSHSGWTANCAGPSASTRASRHSAARPNTSSSNSKRCWTRSRARLSTRSTAWPRMRERLALEPRLCLAANRWGAHRAIGAFFAFISKLGDGGFWYGLAAILALVGGPRGVHAALQMLATGLVAWLLYRTLKRWTRRPRPFRRCDGVIAHVPPLDEFSFPSGHTLHAVSFSIVAIAWF